MRRFRYYLFLFLLTLTLFFNIERIDLLGQQNVLDIQSFVYTFTILAVFSVIFVPTFWQAPPIAPITLWLVLYFVTKIAFLQLFADQNPLWGGAYSSVTLAEVSFLTSLLFYAHRLVNNAAELEIGVKSLLFKDEIKLVDEAREAINSEVMRSRHYHRPMSVIVAEPEAGSLKTSFNQAVQDIQQALSLRYTRNKLAKTMRQQLRLMDMVLEEKNGRFVILCPEVDANESELLIKRIQTAVSQELQINLHCGNASFPEESPTFDGLLTQATEKIRHHQASNGQETYQTVQHVYRSQNTQMHQGS
ncbi:MAG: hypothetical protein R3C62_08235 [Chloroflexota bacterium]